MILLDTSALIGALTGPKKSLEMLTVLLTRGERVFLPAIVIYEWLRGPRTPVELADQENLFPSMYAIPFEAEDAVLAAKLYRAVRRARSREIDLTIAACTIRHNAELWTLNTADFTDIPGLRLFRA